MKEWKQAWWLAKFELKASKLSFLLLLLIYPWFTLGFISSFKSYLDANFVGIDIMFILLFTFAPIWTKPKQFQIQQMGNGLIVAPSVIMLQQLPIAIDTIIKSRFIIYLLYTLPIQILFLISVYMLTPALQEMITIGSYFTFAMIWLSFGVYVGGIIPISDAGDQSSTMKVIIYSILMVLGVIAFFTLIQIVLTHGLIHWTLILAKKWPIISAFLSILFAIIGFHYSQRYMKKTIGKMDYL